MRTLEGIRYLINLDSAEIQQNFAGGVAPPDKVESEVDTTLSIYMSRAELEEISEGLITAYANKFSNRVIQSIDIEHFITEFLMLRIEYASFAEDDAGRIGFLADGATPLLVHQDGKIIPFVFPKDTIVLDKFLLAEKEQGRRRFTMAHEASHHILSKMYAMPSEGRFHAEYDSERSYSKEELAQMFASVEWQADTMGASLLMPRRIIEMPWRNIISQIR